MDGAVLLQHSPIPQSAGASVGFSDPPRKLTAGAFCAHPVDERLHRRHRRAKVDLGPLTPASLASDKGTTSLTARTPATEVPGGFSSLSHQRILYGT